MSAKKIEVIVNEDEFSIPMDISDIINICKEYNNLGNSIQMYIDILLDDGIETALKQGKINQQSIPHIKHFLKAITQNPLFGDAKNQAEDAIEIIETYEKSKSNNVINLFIN